MSAPEGSYFSLVRPKVPQSSRQQDFDSLSPNTYTSASEGYADVTPKPYGPLTPRGDHCSSKASHAPVEGDISDTYGSSRPRKIAFATLEGLRDRTKDESGDADEDAASRNQEQGHRQSRRTSGDASNVSTRRKSLNSRGANGDERYSFDSEESASTDYSGKSSFSSKSRKSSGAISESAVADDFKSSFRSSDFNDDEQVKNFVGISSKAFRRLGLGIEEHDKASAKIAARREGQKLSFDKNKKLSPREQGVYISPSLSSGGASSSEDLSPKEEPHRPSIWRALASGHKKAPSPKDKPRGLRIDLASPNFSFPAAEAQKIATPPIAAQPTLASPHPTASPYRSRSTVSTPDSPVSNLDAALTDTGAKANHSQDVFRAHVEIGQDEEANKYANIPEHLPTSPLCPRHPKHRSGGTGICPYHGRN